MKRWLDKTWAKVLFFCLMIVFTVLTIAGGAGIVYLLDYNAYQDGGTQLYRHIYQTSAYYEGEHVYTYLVEAEPAFTIPPTESYAEMFARDFGSDIWDIEVRLGEELLLTNAEQPETSVYTETFEYVLEDRTLTITVSADPEHRGTRFTDSLVVKLVRWRYELIAATAGCFLIWLYCFIFTLASAGHWQGFEGIHLTWLDRIPIEAWPGAMLFIGVNRGILYNLGPITFIVFGLLIYLFLTVFAAQCKGGTVIKGSACAWILRVLRSVFRWLGTLMGSFPLVWKTVVGLGVVLIMDLICVSNHWDVEFLVFMVLVHVVLGIFLIYLAVGLRKLQKGGQALAAGDYSTKVDTRFLFGDFRRHGEELNTIQEGVRKAVEQQMRSERMKTELITNVSHDIKTPLTSIINYVDLLKKEHIENPKAVEYIDVLERQSSRLRKLTEDLVEASKASTGNIPVTFADTDVNVLLSQVMGEYQQRLTEGQIEPVLTLDQKNPHIQADGRLLWRVLDNLLSNVCKYSMPGTRVYLSSETADGKVLITVRNISRYPLNISTDELTERFVRGDASRSTEGSGLGLSIAMGLTNLQKGEFKLSVDGDLFKVQLVFTESASADGSN
ncbi:MAG: HAMP domain-containing histidine kinase [Firmicutes bacterium]|nr:HAMP domain-containing histidine kinase [Bacillota bacterium]